MLDVYADRCGPGKDLKPIAGEVSAELGDRLRALELDYDQAEQARRKYALDAVPTLLVTVGGVPVARILGAMEKDELLSQLHPLLSVRSAGEGTPASPRGPEVVDTTPQGWTPDHQPAGPAHGTVEVPADRIVWPFVNQTGPDPVDLQFLRQPPADGLDRPTVRTSAVTGSGPAELAHLTSLSRLSVHAERLTQPSSQSSQLDEPRLDVPEADGRMVTDVMSLPRLRELYLCSEAVTDAGLTLLPSADTELGHLIEDREQVDGVGTVDGSRGRPGSGRAMVRLRSTSDRPNTTCSQATLLFIL